MQQVQQKNCDVIIVGSGVAGLYSALKLDSKKKIIIITKAEKAEDCDSYLAQGGICMLKSEDDYEAYFEDTMRAGHYENRRESVDIMIRSSQNVIRDLIGFGVDFELPPEYEQKYAARTPIGRTGKPEDLAKVIAYLVSPANTYMTGTAVDVSGGMIMR